MQETRFPIPILSNGAMVTLMAILSATPALFLTIM